jgi:hypothetical protein
LLPPPRSPLLGVPLAGSSLSSATVASSSLPVPLLFRCVLASLHLRSLSLSLSLEEEASGFSLYETKKKE